MKKSDPNFTNATKIYCDLMAEGKGTKVALEKSGLSHAMADLAWYGDKRNSKHVELDPQFVTLPEAAQQVRVLEMRSAQKLSWGVIAVITGKPESWVRNTFGKAAGVSSEGTRVNKGGRFLEREPRFYLGNRKGIGVEDPKPRLLNPTEVAKNADDAKSVLPAKLAIARKGTAARVRKATKDKKVA